MRVSNKCKYRKIIHNRYGNDGVKINKTQTLILYDVSNISFTTQKKIRLVNQSDLSFAWQLAIFTMAGIAIVAVKMLNFCVRDGNRCVHLAIITRLFLRNIPSKPNNR